MEGTQVEAYLRLRNWLADEEGQGMVEYGLIIALVAIAVILVLTTLGTTLTNTFSNIASAVTV